MDYSRDVASGGERHSLEVRPLDYLAPGSVAAEETPNRLQPREQLAASILQVGTSPAGRSGYLTPSIGDVMIDFVTII